MKRVTASDARKNWFRLLDEVAAGEVVCIERGGRRILIQQDPQSDSDAAIPDYSSALGADSVRDADRWSWEWAGPGAAVQPRHGEEA